MPRTLAWRYWFIRRDTIPERVAMGDNTEYVVEVGIRLYEGDITTQNELYADESNPILRTVPVTRFRLLERLPRAKIPVRLIKHVSSEYDDGGNVVIVVKPASLGMLVTDTDAMTSAINKLIL